MSDMKKKPKNIIPTVQIVIAPLADLFIIIFEIKNNINAIERKIK
jgi:hypothetical protein